jgi:hypothetical protein
MTLDGSIVSPKVGYTVTGSFNPAKPDYRHLKLSYHPSSALSYGTHKVVVWIKDQKGKTSKSSWSFNVNAPYKATFSSALPASGSSSMLNTPIVSVIVYDKYGVSGLSKYFSMKLDGASQSVTMSRVKGFGTMKFKLSFPVTSARALSVASHTVVVTVKDVKGKSSTYTWSFTVIPYVIPEMPTTLALTSCTSCHVNYPAAHPMDQCPLCHGAGHPVGGATLTSATVSAHTAACAAATPCHGGGGAFPHVLSSDCATCHSGSYSDIPVAHTAASIVGAHTSTSTFCTKSGCHNASLTREHYNHTVGGVPLSCATCHTSTDANVMKTIAAGSTACEDCHDVGTTTAHPLTSAHIISGDCAIPGCHVASASGAANVAVIHGTAVTPNVLPVGCIACHGTGVTASTVCVACHQTNTYHSGVAVLHNLPSKYGACVLSGCHSSADVSLIHAEYGFGCVVCHAPGVTPSTECSNCHGNVPHTDITSTLHTAPQVAPQLACEGPQCHSTNVLTIHNNNCADCHSPVEHPSTDCTSCHTTIHSNQNASHVVSNGCTTGTGCHDGSDVAVLHNGACSDCHANPDGHPATLVCTVCHGTPHDLVKSHAATSLLTSSTVMIINGVSYGSMSCSTCHASNDLRDIHSDNCAACHTKTQKVDTLLGGTWNKDCVQGGCHAPNGANPLHGHISASHETSSGVTTSCGGVGCHNDVTDAAAIHANHGSCADCHLNPTHAASLICSDCHDLTDHTTVHVVDQTGDTCATCHAGTNLLPIHINSGSDLTCATCHVSSDTNVQGAIANHQVACSSCHKFTDHESTHVVDQTGDTCAACHDGSNLLDIHINSGTTLTCDTCHKSTDTNVKTAIANQQVACSNCHMFADHTALHVVDQTGDTCATCHAGSNLLDIHSALTCITCHKSDDIQIKLAIANGQVACASCHTFPDHVALHVVDQTGDTCTGSTCHPGSNLLDIHINSGTSLTCNTCHKSNDSNVTTAITNQQVACSNCHKFTDHTALHDVDQTGDGCVVCHAGTNLLPIHINSGTTRTCATCHKSTDPNVTTAISSQETSCVVCHAVTPASHTAHIATVTADVIFINGNSYGSRACSDCHGNSGTGNTQIDLQKIAGHDKSCATCHPAAASLPLGDFDCQQSGCHLSSATTTGTAVVYHVNVSTAHDTTSGVATNCGGTGCHGDVSDVAIIHNALGRPDNGCGICHDGTIVSAPTLNCAAATGCHPTYPVKDLTHTAHVATVTADVMTINGTSYGSHDCSDCHGNSGAGNTQIDLQKIAGHDKSCATCHPAASSLPLGYFDCQQSGCHLSSATTTGTAVVQHTNISTAHDTTSGVAASCGGTGCHGDVSDVAKIHNALGHADHGCGICHDGTIVSSPTLNCAAATGCHPTYPVKDVTHTAHVATLTVGAILINGHSYTQTCSDCHGNSGAGNTQIDLQKIAGHDKSCATCHPAASSLPLGYFACQQSGCHLDSATTTGTAIVQHANASAAHDTTSGVATNCGGTGCHGDVSDVAIIHNALGRADHGCGICHDGTIVSAPTLNCAAATGCHPTYPVKQASHTSHVATLTAGAILINGTSYTETCSDCHGNSGTGNSQIDLQKITQHTSCTTCHPAASSLPPGYFACSQSGCHLAGTTTGTAVGQHANASTAHTVSAQTCTVAGCHAGAFSGGSDIAAIHNVSNANKCATCHGGSKVPKSDCQTTGCHTGTDTYPMLAYSSNSSVIPHTGEVALHNTAADSECNNCHGTGGSNWCHSGYGTDCDVGGFSSDLPAIHAAQGGCAACHAPGVTIGDDPAICQNCHDISGMTDFYNNGMD